MSLSPSNFSEYSLEEKAGWLPLYVTLRGRRTVAWMDDGLVRKNRQLIPHWKLFLPEAYGERGAIPAMVLGPPIVAPPQAVCTQTYLASGPFGSEEAARSADSYVRTRFFRFLVSLRKISQHALRSTYSWVPQQPWDRAWSDDVLNEKYNLTQEEVGFIESMIRPMEAGGE